LIKNKNSKEIEKLKQEIIKYQLKFYNSSEVELDLYRDFLKSKAISRVALDYMQKRENLFKNTDEI
jgi:hypothetical protein